MTQNQLDIFTYSCLSFANTAHFDEERYISNYIGKNGLDKSSFSEVIRRNYKIAANQHFGVCFTMTCWAYHLLYTMGIDSEYYFLVTTEKGTGFPNHVLLYKFDNEYYICDLAAQIQKIEEIHKTLFLISKYPNNYKKEILDNALKELSNPNLICQTIENYLKNYNGGFLIDATGINDERIFAEIPKIFLIDFLKDTKNNLIK